MGVTLGFLSGSMPGLRRCSRAVIMSGFKFVAERPRLHRRIRLAYQFAPGLRTGLYRLVPKQPPVAAAEMADPNARYIFKPGRSCTAPKGVVTLDQLYHLSRSI